MAAMTASTSMASLSASRLTSRSAMVQTPLLAPRLVALPSRRSVAVEARQTKERPGKEYKRSGVAKYDDAPKINPLQSGFTRRREVFVGRLAMVGFASEVLGELLTGKGALGQIGIYTGLSTPTVSAIVAAIVAFNFITALGPLNPTYTEENQRDVRKRPAGPIQDYRKNIAEDPAGFLGISGFGFTKRNELFVGRLAMLGFAASLIGELNTHGKGPLGQVGFFSGTPINPELAGYGLAVWVGFSLVAVLLTGKWGETQGGEDIY